MRRPELPEPVAESGPYRGLDPQFTVGSAVILATVLRELSPVLPGPRKIEVEAARARPPYLAAVFPGTFTGIVLAVVAAYDEVLACSARLAGQQDSAGRLRAHGGEPAPLLDSFQVCVPLGFYLGPDGPERAVYSEVRQVQDAVT